MGEGHTKGTDAALLPTITVPGGLPAAAATPATGQYRHYRLGALLGRGGMGEVLSADDERIGRSVAVKRMRAAADPVAVERFMREARIQGQLEHPAIVPVHELGEDESGAPIIVMKQVRGTTLAEVLRTGKFTRPRLLRAFVDVCLAIEFAHSRGVVHRDLKPANIALGDFGEVYVLDWGIARVLGDSQPAATQLDGVEPGATQAGAVLGTPGYMAPEQLAGDPSLDGRADVYALGCVLFEILAGDKLGTRAGTPDAMPSRHAPDREIPPELDAACVRATARERDQRYSARELASVVERVLDGDRDLEQRRRLAGQLFEEAKATLAKGDGHSERGAAIRAAGRALALDPSSTEIAALVARLMLEPPKEVPDEVERELVADDLASIQSQRRNAASNTFMVAGHLPLAYVMGVRDAWYFAVMLLAAVAVGVSRYQIVVDGRFRQTMRVVLVSSLIAVVLMTASYMSPVLALPFALIVLIRSALQPRIFLPRLVLVSMLVAVITPGLLGVLGVLPQTVVLSGGILGLVLPADTLQPAATAGWLIYLALTTMFVTYAAARLTARIERDARRSLRVQAWKLRQLVPTPD